jgi:hypothetical protein
MSPEFSNANAQNVLARSYTMPYRRAEAVEEDGGTYASKSHLHAQRRYKKRLENGRSQLRRPLLSIGIPGAGSK